MGVSNTNSLSLVGFGLNEILENKPISSYQNSEILYNHVPSYRNNHLDVLKYIHETNKSEKKKAREYEFMKRVFANANPGSRTNW